MNILTNLFCSIDHFMGFQKMVHICVDQCGFSNKEFLQKIVVQHYVPGSSESMIKKQTKT